MTSDRIDRPTLLVGVLMLVLAGVGAWSFGRLRESRAAAATASRSLADCQRLVDRIRHLDDRPATAHAQQIHLNELTHHIEQSTRSARIDPDSLVRIWPDPPTRIGDSPYQKKSTQVLFRQVTLRQVIVFLHHIAAQEGGPRATRLRLVTPRGGESGDHWTAETTLTYLIYAPRIEASG